MQALAALLSRNTFWDDRLETALLSENNQPNVTFILELMIGRTIDTGRLSKLLEKVNYSEIVASLRIERLKTNFISG